MKTRIHRNAVPALALALAAGMSQAAGPVGSGIFAEADTVETVSSNAAGMARLKGTQITVDGVLAVNFSKFKVDESRTTVDGGDPRKPDPVAIPSFYYSHQFRDDWFVGYSLNVPTGFGASSGPNWAGRYYNDRSSLIYIALTPALAYAFSDKFSVGGGVRIMYSSTDIHTRVNNNIIGDRYPDGRIKMTSDGVGYGASLSALYSFSPDTRIGLTWNSEVDIDLDTDVEFRNVRLPQEIIDRLQSQTIKVKNKVPMTAGAGLYHRLQNDWEVTLDVLWVEFSRFGVTEISVEGGDIKTPYGLYNDFFAVSVGTRWPINGKMRGELGALWVEKPVDDDVRSFGLALDEMWGIGGGINYKLDNGNDLDFSINLIDTGKSPIDTGFSLSRGRVAGEYKNPYVLVFDFTYNWR